MTHSDLVAHKLGISGESKNRVQQHRREGWETYRTIKINTGELAYQVEQEVFYWLSETFGWTPYLSKTDMPQGGYTETIDASEFDLPTIWTKVEELIQAKIDA